MGRSAEWIDSLGELDRTPLSLRAGETVFRQGQAVSAIYVVKAGRVRLIRQLADGSSVAVHVARPGDAFAEAALFAECYHCDAVADADSEIQSIPKAAVRARLESDPSLGLSLANALAAQVREVRARLELRNIRSARARILAWLRLRADHIPGTVELDRPWTAVAMEVGLTHEAVYRVLSALEREGVIQREKGRVRLIG